MGAGDRDELVSFVRETTSADDYGEQISTGVEVLAECWAQVRFGSSREKREAAQEAGSQSATFLCDRYPSLDAVKISDQIVYDGSDWDIVEVAPLDRMILRFTAVRSR